MFNLKESEVLAIFLDLDHSLVLSSVAHLLLSYHFPRKHASFFLLKFRSNKPSFRKDLWNSLGDLCFIIEVKKTKIGKMFLIHLSLLFLSGGLPTFLGKLPFSHIYHGPFHPLLYMLLLGEWWPYLIKFSIQALRIMWHVGNFILSNK